MSQQQPQPYQKYTKVAQPAPPSNPDQHEIRVTTSKPPKTYIQRAIFLFKKKELDHVILKASGAAISTLCISAEIIRNTLKNLHQLNKITNTTIIDVYEPNEEGLDTVTVQRKMAILEVKLMKEATEDEKKFPGYQQPIEPDFLEKNESVQRGYRRGQRYQQRGMARFQQQQQQEQPYQDHPQRFNYRSRNMQQRRVASFRGRFRSRGNFNQRPPQYDRDQNQNQYQFRGNRPRRMIYNKFQQDREDQNEQQKEVVHRGPPVMRRGMGMIRRPGHNRYQ